VSAFSRKPVRIGPERCPESSGTSVRFRPDYTGRLQPRLPHHPPPRRGGPPGRALRRQPLPTHPKLLTFFAQDHASAEMVYANADITKAEQAKEVIAFADSWSRVAGADPGLLCFDSKLTTYPMLEELCARRITFLTLRQRGPNVLEALAALPASAWATYAVKRSGATATPRSTRRSSTSKASATRCARSPSATSATTSPPVDHQRPHRRGQGSVLPLRRADDHRERARRRHLRVPAQRPVLRAALNVDVDTTLTVLAGNCYGCWPARCPATSSPPPTGCGATSSTTPGPSPSQRTTSASTWPYVPTPPCSSTPGSPSLTCPSHGGAAEPFASASRPAETSTRLLQ